MSAVRPSRPRPDVPRAPWRARLLAGALTVTVALGGVALTGTAASAHRPAAGTAGPRAAAAERLPVELLTHEVQPVVRPGQATWVFGYFVSSGGGTVTGTVEIAVAGQVVGTFPLDRGSFIRSVVIPPTLAPGEQVLTIRYLGTERFAPTSEDLPITVLQRGYVSRTPVRVLDSPVAGTVCTDVRATGHVPAAATNLMLNVTAVAPSAPGYVVVYPDTTPGRTPVPAGSTVNFETATDVANSAYVEVPPSGRVCYTTAGAASVRILLDLVGYATSDSGLVALPSTRVLDTRPGGVGDIDGPLLPGRAYEVPVLDDAGVPVDADAVLVNATVTGVTGVGNLRVYAGDELVVPTTSTVNYVPGRDKANVALVARRGGTIRLYSDSSAPVHVVLDVIGYTQPDSVVRTQRPRPERILDTRTTNPLGGPLAPRRVYALDLSEEVSRPRTTAVVLNVTAVNATGVGNLRVYPDTNGDGTTAPPDASSLNYVPGRAVPNQVVVGVPESGRIALYSDTHGGSVDVVVDLVGYVLD